MARVKQTAFALIYFLIGLLITRILWYAINPIMSMFEGSTFMLSIAWIGLFSTFLLLVVFPPIYSLIQGTIPNLYYVGKSAVSVIIGLIIVRISWTIIPIILSLLGTDNPEQSSIMWIFLILMWIITLIVIPIHFASESIKE